MTVKLAYGPGEIDFMEPWRWPLPLLAAILQYWRLEHALDADGGLRKRRDGESGLSQVEAGRVLGTNRWTMHRIEGLRHQPRAQTIITMRNAAPGLFEPCAECGKVHPGGEWARQYHKEAVPRPLMDADQVAG